LRRATTGVIAVQAVSRQSSPATSRLNEEPD
jgi:hypothetical protein